MDANGLRSFGLSLDAGLYAWRVPSSTGRAVATEPAPQHRVTGVRLASRSHGLRLREDFATVAEVPLQPALAMDGPGNHVRWDGEALSAISHLAEKHGLAPQRFMLPPEALPVTDLAVGDDDVLYLAAGAALWLIDLRARFELTRFGAPEGFTPQRLCAMPGGGVMALDVERGALARTRGLPLFTRGVAVGGNEDRFNAQDPNPRPLRWQRLRGSVPSNERSVSLATHRHGHVVVLSLLRPNGGARLRVVLRDGRLSLPLRIDGPRLPHTVGWLDGERIAIATRGVLEAPGGGTRDPGVWTYALPGTLIARVAEASGTEATALPAPLSDALQALGDYYPLAGWTGGPFVNGRPGERLHYPRRVREGAVLSDAEPLRAMPARVARISGGQRSRYGVVANTADGRTPGARVLASVGLIDTGKPDTVWHRLYVEAAVPTGCAMVVWLAAGGTAPPRFVPGEPQQRANWYPHLVGDRSALPPEVAAALPADLPRAAWVPQPTEVPHGQAVLCCSGDGDRLKGQSGLFTVLIQRAATTVRALQGQTLWVAAELFGDGRATPELAALRAYAGRMSYRDRYLPALYHERVFCEDSDRPGRATGADFLDRYLNLFEGLFTDIEDRIAASALMTDAMACPPEALPWLASWVGLAMSEGLSAERRRWMLSNAPQLARRHGTLQGLQLALDIATDGAVTRGRIVVVEDFRLRRTLATILGARLEDATDPLTLGLTRSGNSVIGDSLFLGDAKTLGEGQLKTFLALFRRIEGQGADAARLNTERAAASKALFDDLAHRVTVLVHETLDDDELRLIQRLAASHAPGHVRVRVIRAVYPFMVGVAALVGADSYLRSEPPEQPFRVSADDEGSALGGIDTLRGEASLDAHAGAFEGVLPPFSARPVARIVSPDLGWPPAPEGEPGPSDDEPEIGPLTSFRLDGSASAAADEREITEYRWTHLPPNTV
jgi:phage tail-like protein